MAANILITGGSGYLGGSLVSQLQNERDLPPYGTIYALVRNPEQAEKTKKFYNATPLELNVDDQDDITRTLLAKEISIVFFLIDARFSETAVRIIKALSAVQEKLGVQTHFLHTTGAKVFSSHAGAPTDRPLSDTDERLYDIQKNLRAPHELMQVAANTNNTVIDTAEEHGVRSYIFAPCIVYGKGTGFGNPISIQTVAIIRAAKKLRQVYKVDQGKPTWPVCHVYDTTTLYIQLLRKILANEPLGHGKHGYYLAASGSVAWDDIYAAMADSLAKRGAVNDASVREADEHTLAEMGEALGCPSELVAVQLGGLCTFTADHGRRIGWTPRYRPGHVLEAADAEVELVLASLDA